jgi:hypothetical protein
MISLDDVLSEWKEDCKIDKVLLDESARQLPNLHAKYLDYHTQFQRQQRLLKRKKSEIPASDRRGNESYLQVEELLSQQQDAIDATNEILKAIHQMSFTISTMVKWRVFLNGTPDNIL